MCVCVYLFMIEKMMFFLLNKRKKGNICIKYLCVGCGMKFDDDEEL